MAAFNIQESLMWKEKVELTIDQVCLCGILVMYSHFPF